MVQTVKMKHQFVSRPHPEARNYSLVHYVAALLLQALFFYGGFRYLLAAETPPVFRLIAACVFFPLATAAAVWGGHIALHRKGEKHYGVFHLFETLPVRIFLGVVLAAIIVAIMQVADSF